MEWKASRGRPMDWDCYRCTPYCRKKKRPCGGGCGMGPPTALSSKAMRSIWGTPKRGTRKNIRSTIRNIPRTKRMATVFPPNAGAPICMVSSTTERSWKTFSVRQASPIHRCPITGPLKNDNTTSWRNSCGSISIWHLFISNWQNDMLEGHGDDAWKYNSPIKADFSSNVLYGPLDDRLLAHLRDVLPNVTHYPEAGARRLQKAAAKAYGVDEGRLLATNGVTEAIYLIAQAFREREAVIYTPAFAEYADACAVQGMKISYRDWADLRTGKLPKNGLVFLCNPNNPTGWTVALKTFGEYPDALFVVDESYIEF